jgi:hypothetical protein
MRRWIIISALATAFVMSNPAARAMADDEEDGGSRGQENYAFGVGAGLIRPSGQTEDYFMASLRIRAHRSDRGEGQDGVPRSQGITGFFEPEVGFWERSSSNGNRLSGRDSLFGVNLIGVAPFGRVENFFGIGAGIHSVDAKLLTGDATATGTESKLGLNAQFGVDIFLTDRLSLFGAGRFDLVQGADDNTQTKVYIGLRGRW